MGTEVTVSEDGFVNLLLAQNGGAFIDELDREVMKGVQAMLDHGGTSEINVKIKLKRIPNMETAINCVADVTAKHPKEPRPEMAMFVTQGSGLTNQYQAQESLPLTPAKAVERQPLTPVSKITPKD